MKTSRTARNSHIAIKSSRVTGTMEPRENTKHSVTSIQTNTSPQCPPASRTDTKGWTIPSGTDPAILESKSEEQFPVVIESDTAHQSLNIEDQKDNNQLKIDHNKMSGTTGTKTIDKSIITTGVDDKTSFKLGKHSNNKDLDCVSPSMDLKDTWECKVTSSLRDPVNSYGTSTARKRKQTFVIKEDSNAMFHLPGKVIKLNEDLSDINTLSGLVNDLNSRSTVGEELCLNVSHNSSTSPCDFNSENSLNKRHISPKSRLPKKRLYRSCKSIEEHKILNLERKRKKLTNVSQNTSVDLDGKKDKCDILICPALQIDTMSCREGNMKKRYSRVVTACLLDGPFVPQRAAVSSNGDAVHTRITYDKEGKVVVLEPLRFITEGLYRVINTLVGRSLGCLNGCLALETVLVRASSWDNLLPQSQYLYLSEMYAIPKSRWREQLSATMVRHHLEDYLHGYTFHNYTLPLLRWNGEEDVWNWTTESTIKFSSNSKKNGTPQTTQ